MNTVYGNALLHNPFFLKQREFWKVKLKTYLPAKDTICSKNVNPNDSNEIFENITFRFNDDLSYRIQTLCGSDNLALYIFLTNSLKLVLNYYTSGEATTIVSPTYISIENSEKGKTKSNIILLYDIFDDEDIIADSLDKLSKSIIAAYKNQDYPFEKLFTIFNTTYSLKEYLPETLCALSNIHTINNIIIDYGINLNFLFNIDNKGISCEIIYNKDYYSEYFIKNFFSHILNVSSISIDKPNTKIKNIDILSQEEKEQLLFQFNNTNYTYSYNKNAYVLFEEQADRTPDKIAACLENKNITYKEIRDLINKIANYIVYKGVTIDNQVCIHMNRSIEMIATIFGIMKAGGCFVPIDTAIPDVRKKYIIDICNPKIIISEKYLKIPNLGNDISIISIDDIKSLNHNFHKNYPEISCNQIAYVLFTSGSTGNPKGVVIEHKCLNNFINSMSKLIELNTEKTILALTSISFDIFILEIIAPITKGTEIILANEQVQKDNKRLIQLIEKKCINIIQTTPSRLKILMKYEDSTWVKSLSEFVIGGEALPDYLYSMLASKCNCRIFNMYGPTETTVWSTFSELKRDELVTIGKPIDNTQIYILNKNNKILPIGVTGEIYIGGDGVGRGYFNNELLTKERFLIDPFRNNNKIYKTGDKGNWGANGDINFIGRDDRQIKIRGYRIELAEIEKTLIQHPKIKESCVLIKKNNDSLILCAYIVLNETENYKIETSENSAIDTITEDNEKSKEIVKFISQKLPEYMVPDKIYYISKIPLTTSNKIDYVKLNTYKIIERIDSIINEPVTLIEIELANLFKQILNRYHIGVNDNFFDLGGNSLKVAILLASIQKNYNVVIPFSEIANNATIDKLATLIINSQQIENTNHIKTTEKKEHLSLSFSQIRIYFLHQFYLNSTIYNSPFLYKVYGRLDEKSLSEAINKIVDQQESLRTNFILVNGEPRQKIQEKVKLTVKSREINENEITKHIKQFIRPFDLTKEFPIRVEVLNCIEHNYSFLLIDLHHIISDGVSFNIFLNNLKTLMEGRLVQSLKYQYKDYIEFEVLEKESNNFAKSEKFWLEVYKKEVRNLILPFKKNALDFAYSGDYIIFEIDDKLAKKIRLFSAENKVTPYIFFLSIYNVLMSKLCSQDDIVIGSPISIRTINTDNIIGNFINTIALRNKISVKDPFKKTLENVKKITLESFDHRFYPFERLVRNLFKKRGKNDKLFNVMLDYHNEVDGFKQIQINEINLELIEDPRKISLFDLNLHIVEGDTTFSLKLDYNLNLFDSTSIEYIKTNFLYFIEKLIEEPDTTIENIHLKKENITNDMKYKIEMDFDFK